MKAGQQTHTGDQPAVTRRPALAIGSSVASAAAIVSIVSSSLALFLLIVLHFVRPDLAPSWRFLSEYASGPQGGLMVLAFLFMATSHAALWLAASSSVRTLGGYLGLAFLAASVVGLVIAGLNPMDPLTADPDNPSRQGQLHALGTMIGMPSTPIAAVLLSHALVRCPASRSDKLTLLSAAHVTWISLAVMMAALFVLLPANGGKFGPEVPAGWLNRAVVLAFVVWAVAAALYALNLSRSSRTA